MSLNTTISGQIRTIIYQENKTWYGSALEFNLTVDGDSPLEVSVLLQEAIAGYLETAQKAKMSPSVLNQKVDSTLESLWKATEAKKEKQKVYQTGTFKISAFA